MADMRKFCPFPGFRYVRGKDFINGNLQFRYTAWISRYVYPIKSVKKRYLFNTILVYILLWGWTSRCGLPYNLRKVPPPGKRGHSTLAFILYLFYP